MKTKSVNNLPEKSKRVVLGVAAHPDDLDFGASGTIAKWVNEGATCYYLICTDGSKGSSDLNINSKTLIKMRQNEQIAAAKILGVKEVFFLKHTDTQLVADLTLKKEIVRYIRMLKPDIVITMDPTLVYSVKGNFVNHTDHRSAGFATIDAVYPMARDRLTFSDLEKKGLLPHKVNDLYLVNMENGNEAIDISGTIDIKIKALLAHKSQISSEAIDRVKKRAGENGKKYGYRYAEVFQRITLR